MLTERCSSLGQELEELRAKQVRRGGRGVWCGARIVTPARGYGGGRRQALHDRTLRSKEAETAEAEEQRSRHEAEAARVWKQCVEARNAAEEVEAQRSVRAAPGPRLRSGRPA